MLRGWRIVAVSLTVHVAVLLLLSPVQKDVVPAPAASPVTIRLVTPAAKAPDPRPAAIQPQAAARATSASRPTSKAAQSTSRATTTPPSTSVGPAGAQQPPSPRYADLLPGAGWQPSAAAEPQGPSAGDHPTFTVETRNFSKLSSFAKDLSERITIPAAIRKLAPSGRATARFARDTTTNTWQVIRATGDPYYRALLFDALTSLTTTSFALAQLDPSDYRVINVTLTFATVSPLDQTQKPVTTSTHENSVTLAYTTAASAAVWNLAMPIDNKEGDDMVIPNLLGMGMLAADALTAENPLDDVEVKRLRLSPAFLKPIGR